MIRNINKVKFAALAAISMAALIGSQSLAQANPDGGHPGHRLPPIGNGQPLPPGTYLPSYSGPYGYDSLVDLSREVNGVPCGIDCQQRALHRWGYTANNN